MTPELRKVLADLAVIRQIALRPGRDHPVLALAVAQAQALDEIATWAQNAEALMRQQDVASSQDRLGGTDAEVPPGLERSEG